MLPGEKKILSELLEMYKDLPCLWKQTHLFYNNKESRRKAFELLFEKYKSCNETATMDDMKKKIENMRTTYRREMKKVLAARVKGEEDYRPTLWYFDLMSFIDKNENSCWASSDHTTSDIDEDKNEESETEYLVEEPQCKRRKLRPAADDTTVPQDCLKDEKPDISRIFLTSDGNESVIDINTDDELPSEKKISQEEAVSFGRSVGLQLNELDGLQRIVAEKLISDTIFYARLRKLTTESTIQLK